MTAQENEALVRAQIDVYNSHHTDPDWFEKRVVTLADDFAITDMPSGRIYRGVEGFRQNSQFYAEAFPDHEVEITNVVATEDQVVVEFIGRGTHTGPLHTPTGDIPPTGRRGELRCCNVYQIKNGKIASLRSYYDAASMLRQLGLVS